MLGIGWDGVGCRVITCNGLISQTGGGGGGKGGEKNQKARKRCLSSDVLVENSYTHSYIFSPDQTRMTVQNPALINIFP